MDESEKWIMGGIVSIIALGVGTIMLNMILTSIQSESLQAVKLCNTLSSNNRDACYTAIIELGLTTDE